MRFLALALAYLWSTSAYAGQPCKDPNTGRFVPCDSLEEILPVHEVETAEPTPEPTPKPRGLRMSIAAGVTAGVSTDVAAEPQPYIGIRVQSPLTSLENGPDLEVRVALESLPESGDGVSLEDPGSVKAFSGAVGLSQPLGRTLRFRLYGDAGVASRLVSSAESADRLPGYFSVGLLFRTDDGDHWLKIGGGPDQRLSGDWATSIHAEGQVKIRDVGKAKVSASLSVIRALDLSRYGFARAPAKDWWAFSLVAGL